MLKLNEDPHLHRWRPEPDKAREETLVQLTVLLESHRLHDGGKLVVIPDKNHALQPAPEDRIQIL